MSAEGEALRSHPGLNPAYFDQMEKRREAQGNHAAMALAGTPISTLMEQGLGEDIIDRLVGAVVAGGVAQVAVDALLLVDPGDEAPLLVELAPVRDRRHEVYRTECTCINLDYFMQMHLVSPSINYEGRKSL